MHKFKGTGVALVTPFEEDGKIDWAGLEKLIHHVISNKVEYLVSMGTTGESVTLSEAEKFSVIDFTVKIANRRVPVVAGFGGNNTSEIIHQIQTYHFTGVDGILSNSPYYNKPSQEGIYQHYLAIDKVAPLPVIVYNVPGRTSSNMEAETSLRIARDTSHVIGIKEASGNFSQIMKIAKDRDRNFLLISGDDAITLPILSFGGDGVISVVANAMPKDFSDMVRLGLEGDFLNARLLHFKLLDFTELLFKEGSPAGVKCALKEIDICKDHVRLPLWKVSDGLAGKIKDAIGSLL
ncbi:MAG: 4-hydroxy-tetrahydrodipicolinate synthase [Chitinophagales bacterium]|nr:4-hydroxy-tetrahydrodipicolinate synthase [Chitinophagales bacterium]